MTDRGMFGLQDYLLGRVVDLDRISDKVKENVFNAVISVFH